jgi:hypothetical protein
MLHIESFSPLPNEKWQLRVNERHIRHYRQPILSVASDGRYNVLTPGFQQTRHASATVSDSFSHYIQQDLFVPVFKRMITQQTETI